MRPTTLRLLAMALAVVCHGWAQDTSDQPGRGVARLSLINGDVSVRRGDSGDWVAAAVNAPLVVEDRVSTGPGSRAEVQFDWANMVRLAADSEIRLAQLDSQRYIIQIARGTVTFRVLRDTDAEVEISTPSVSVRPVRRGSYRITVREDGESEITARSGEAEIFTPRGVERLRSGRTMLTRGSASDPEFQTMRAIGEDNWDRWNEQRDRYIERAQGYRYAHRSVYGLEDLDGHGEWVYIAPYGWSWRPRVAVGWVPYYYGRWTWIDWYGWTWVSYDPWGWAPYHYGRWFYHRPYGWCWYPGGLYVRHYWRPALVVFVGFGGYGGGWGRIGWVPLAPYETYYPWYGSRYYHGYRNPAYIDNSVNIVNNINITNVYRNARIANAVTAVDVSQFGRGGGNMVRVSGNELNRAGLVKGQLPVAPGRESLRLADREARVVHRPESVDGGRFFSRNRPEAVERVPFDEQRRGMEEISRRAFGERGAQAADSVRAPQSPARGGAVREAPPRAAEPGVVRLPESPGRETGGWRRLGEGASGTATPGIRRAEPMNRQGEPRTAEPRGPDEGRREAEGRWRRFGEPQRGVEAPSPRQAEPMNRQAEERTVEPRGQGMTRQEPWGGWRRFGESGATGQGTLPPAIDLSRREQRGGVLRERSDSPRSEQPEFASPQRGLPRVDRGDRHESIRVSPPIVRERQAAPRYEAPPRVQRAPEARGGGDVYRGAPGGGEMRGGETRGQSRGEQGGQRGRTR